MCDKLHDMMFLGKEGGVKLTYLGDDLVLISRIGREEAQTMISKGGGS